MSASLTWSAVARWSRLMSHLPVAVVAVDSNGVIRVWNDAAAALYRCPVDDAVGHRFGDLFETNMSPDESQGLLDCVMSGALWEGTINVARRDGSPVDVQVVIAPVMESGAFDGFVTTLLDTASAEASHEAALVEWRHFAEATSEALDAERDRFARELHDDLGQCLTAARSELLGLESLDDQRRAETLARVDALLADGIDSIRRICDDLRPRLLDEVGVCTALEVLTQSFEQRTGVACTTIIDHDRLGWVTPRGESVVYRVLQEALTNVERHATNARQVVVEFTSLGADGNLAEAGAVGTTMALVVTNDGSSYEGGRGLGIVSMQQRARSLGGELTLRGAPGGGTTLTLSVPAERAFTERPADRGS